MPSCGTPSTVTLTARQRCIARAYNIAPSRICGDRLESRRQRLRTRSTSTRDHRLRSVRAFVYFGGRNELYKSQFVERANWPVRRARLHRRLRLPRRPDYCTLSAAGIGCEGGCSERHSSQRTNESQRVGVGPGSAIGRSAGYAGVLDTTAGGTRRKQLHGTDG